MTQVGAQVRAPLTSLNFIQRMTDLKNWGAKVIVDDIGFFTQPYFEEAWLQPMPAQFPKALS